MSTIFEEEIRSQGSLIAARAAQGALVAAQVAESFGSCTHLVVAARGSSDNAAVFFQYLVGQVTGRLVALAAPSLFENPATMDLSGAGVVAISQSGRSPGIGDVLASARGQGRPSVAITNDVDSPLADLADCVVSLGVGPERAIASTKTFSSTWHALAQVVEAMSGEALEGLADTSKYVDDLVGWALGLELPLDLLDAQGLTMVGRGIGYAVASEIALKVREVTGVRAECYAAPDYLHGPIGADGSGSSLVLLLSDELSDEVARDVLLGCEEAGMQTVVVRPPHREGTGADEDIVLPREAPNWLTGLGMVLVGQVLALRLGQRRGRPIDTSPRLHKVTLSA
ncbi:MAG: SIS domain-containing protein [Acidimicrobiaceae bacterium]|nr:SIS domain-containing protein [Acidimicrobiaceae bacterium]